MVARDPPGPDRPRIQELGTRRSESANGKQRLRNVLRQRPEQRRRPKD